MKFLSSFSSSNTTLFWVKLAIETNQHKYYCQGSTKFERIVGVLEICPIKQGK